MDQPADIRSADQAMGDAPPIDREYRQTSVFRVGALNVEGRRELCIVRNISAKGMMIRAYSPVAPGTRLSIELKQGERIDATVRWVRDSAAGVEFDQPVEVESLLAQSPDMPRPRMPRIDIDAPAAVRIGTAEVEAHATDISQGGVCVTLDDPPRPATNVVVTLDGMAPRSAVVKWVSEGVAGLGFERVIPVGELVDWLHRQRGDAA